MEWGGPALAGAAEDDSEFVTGAAVDAVLLKEDKFHRRAEAPGAETFEAGRDPNERFGDLDPHDFFGSACLPVDSDEVMIDMEVSACFPSAAAAAHVALPPRSTDLRFFVCL